MAVSRALRRLLQIRDLEEEQSRVAVESARLRLHDLEGRLKVVCSRERQGRDLVETSVRTGELTDRQAGAIEVETARRQGAALEPRIVAGRREAAQLQEAYLVKRVERRQAQTLVERIEAQEAAEDVRREQGNLDDWFRGRKYRSETDADAD